MSLVDDYVEMLTTPTQKTQNAIIRGGITYQNFEVPFSVDQIDFLVITYVQCGKIKMRKLINDVYVEPADSEGEYSYIIYEISEAESMRFEKGKKVEVQIKINLFNMFIPSNTPTTSKIFKLDVIEQLDNALVTESIDEVNAVEIYNEGRKLYAVNFYDIVTNNNNLKCRFLLDAFWRDSDAIIAVFKDEYDNVAEVPLIVSDYCYIPDIVLKKPGKIYFGVKTLDSTSEACCSTSEWSNSIVVRKGCE